MRVVKGSQRNKRTLHVVQDYHDICRKCVPETYEKFDDMTGSSDDAFQIPCSFIQRDDKLLNPKLLKLLTEEEQKMALGLMNAVAWAEQHLINENGTPFSARDYQEEFLRCSAKYIVGRAGRGVGKTAALVVRILFEVFKADYQKVIIFGPQKVHVEELHDRILGFIERSPTLRSSKDRSVKSPIFEITLTNGSRIRGFASGDSSNSSGLSLRGQDAHLIVLDEAAYINRETIDQAVMPLIQRFPHVKLIATSTPSGNKDKFYEWSMTDPKFKEFYWPSSVLPHWDQVKDDIAAHYRDNKDAYLREIMAMHGVSQDGVYRADLVNKTLKDFKYEDMIPEKDVIYSMGVDWNKTVGTEIVLVGYNRFTGKWRVGPCVNIPKQELTQHVALEKIVELTNLWKPHFMYMDEGYGSCVGPETLLQTIDSTKEIKDISIGDRVLTSSGEYKEVLGQVLSEPKESYVLKAAKCIPTTVSYCHPTLTYRSSKRFLDKNISEESFSWRAPEEIDITKDFAAIPKIKAETKESLVIDILDYLPKDLNLEYDDNFVWTIKGYSTDSTYSRTSLSKVAQCGNATIDRLRKNLREGKPLKAAQIKAKGILDKLYGLDWIEPRKVKFNRYIDVASEDFQLFLGWYLSEGSSSNLTIEISQVNGNHTKEFDQLIEIVYKLFPVQSISLVHTESTLLNKKDKRRICISGDIPTQLMKALGGQQSYGKRLHPIMLETNLGPCIRGIIYGDGSIKRNGRGTNISLSLTSFHLVMQVRQQLINNGILPSLRRVKARTEKHLPQLRIDMSGHKEAITKLSSFLGLDLFNILRVDRRKYLETENYFLVPIISLKSIGVVDSLYDIEVEDDHTFCGNGFVLHNTQIEMLKKRGLESVPLDGWQHKLYDIVKGYNFSARLDVRDPNTGEIIKKDAKPFMVENSVRRFEEEQLEISVHDSLLQRQLGNYIVKSRSVTGRPVYGCLEKKLGDHRLDAMNLALVAYKLEMSDFSPNAPLRVAVKPQGLGLEELNAVYRIDAARESSVPEERTPRVQGPVLTSVLGGAVPVYRHGFLSDTEVQPPRNKPANKPVSSRMSVPSRRT